MPCWTLRASVQDVLGRTTLDALIAAGDLGPGRACPELAALPIPG